MRNPLWFGVAGVIALAGFAAAALYVMPRIATIDQGTIRVVVPGNAVFTLDRPGRYTIFHELRSVVDGRAYDSRSVDGLRATLVTEAGGAPVALVTPNVSSEYEMGSRIGRSFLAFDIDQPGRYRLSASWLNGAAEPKLVLAVNQGLMGGMFKLVFGAIGIASMGLGLAVLLVLFVVQQRLKARGLPF
jgi:hypothetical protein